MLRIEDLEKLRAGDQRRAEETIAKRDSQIKELQTSIDLDYDYDESLLEVKSALDLNITAFRKMIEEEEARCGKLSSLRSKRSCASVVPCVACERYDSNTRSRIAISRTSKVDENSFKKSRSLKQLV